MIFFALAAHPILKYSDGHGGTITYYYYDAYTWIVGALALAWLAFFLIRRYRLAKAQRRRPRGTNYRLLKRIVKIKNEFSLMNLQPGFSRTIHAVGLGMLATGEYCIQVFISDPNQELWIGAGASPLPANYRGVPVILIEMPMAGFLSNVAPAPFTAETKYPNGIREHQEVIIGGISGANTNLTGQSGTIGYFCTRKSKLARRREVHLLSNSHVFADLRKVSVDNGDLILQPSPGESGSNRPIAALVNFSAVKFDNIDEPNQIDAAIAKLWGPQQHKAVLPMIGTVKGYVAKNDIEIGEAARKFGRTTGYTEGRIFSIYLDIWVRYDRTGQSAFFQNQFLIEPSLPQFTKFVSQGDSGSLLVDGEQHAIGLIFAGMSEVSGTTPPVNPSGGLDPARQNLPRIESYGVANPISDVLDGLKIDLLV